MAEMSPLRRRMIEDMTVRNLSPATQRSYVHAVAKFSRYFGRSPDRLDLEDVRAFQVHLVANGISWPALNQTVCALRFFYGVTLGHGEMVERIPYAREPRKLPVVLSADEVVRFLEAVPSLKTRDRADDGLCGRAARLRGGRLEGRRYRQRPDGDPRRARQRRQGPLRHAVGATARHPAHLLASSPAAALALSRPRRDRADRRPGAARAPADRPVPRPASPSTVTVHTLRHSFATHLAGSRHRHPHHPGAARPSPTCRARRATRKSRTADRRTDSPLDRLKLEVVPPA